MKICFLAPANNYHTKKWCEYFTSKGHEVHVISFIDDKIDNAIVHYIDTKAKASDSDLRKIKYLSSIKKVKKIVKEIKPDIINAHYATSYGMVAALSKFNFVLSVWGSDVYNFPKKSLIHKLYFKYVLKKAKYIFSTSNAMKEELKKYTSKDIYVTPFGVKMDLFNKDKNDNRYKEYFTIGTVKSLKEKYGIKYIIEAADFLKNEIPNLKVVIAGSGVEEEYLKKLAKEKNINVDFLGTISQDEASNVWANLDIGIIPSIEDSESFGVSVIEAEASSIPVIITDVPGLLETTLPDSRIVVSRENSLEIAKEIKELYNNKKLRNTLGKNGREYVLKNFEYNKCFNYIESLFKSFIKSNKKR